MRKEIAFFRHFSIEVLTNITISYKEYPIFIPRFEPRTSGIRNSDNYYTAFMNYAPSILNAYPKEICNAPLNASMDCHV